MWDGLCLVHAWVAPHPNTLCPTLPQHEHTTRALDGGGASVSESIDLQVLDSESDDDNCAGAAGAAWRFLSTSRIIELKRGAGVNVPSGCGGGRPAARPARFSTWIARTAGGTERGERGVAVKLPAKFGSHDTWLSGASGAALRMRGPHMGITSRSVG